MRRVSLAFVFVLCFALGAVAAKYGGPAFYRHFGVSAQAFFSSPLAYLRVHNRGWNAFESLQYTQDYGGAYFRRYVESGLIPLVIDGTRLSDAYPVPKLGGAITVVDTTVIILDRLGELFRYDLSSRTFARLQIPQLPNNLDAYVLQRPNPRESLGNPENDEFRAHGVTFLSDRNELAVAYDTFDPKEPGTLRTAVSVIPFDPTTLSATGTWQQLFLSDPFAFGQGITSAGGRMAYRGGNKLYLTLGDHYAVDEKLAQASNTTFGRVIEIDLEGNGGREFSKGHRNPQGLTFSKSGQLFSTEHGPRGGDELNIIKEGSNYGWPNVTLGTAYDSYDWNGSSSAVGSHSGYAAPLFAWVPSIAPSQLIEINNFHPRWDGDLLVASLKGLSLVRLRLNAGHVLYSEPIWIGQRIRDLAQTKNGTLVLWTDDTQLQLITVDTDQIAEKRRTPDIIGTVLVDHNCMDCHHFGPTNPGDFAPSLSNVLGRPIASDSFKYSLGLRAKQGNWTKDLLFQFLDDPSKFASGTSMKIFSRLTAEEIADIIDALAKASAPASQQRRANKM